MAQNPHWSPIGNGAMKRVPQDQLPDKAQVPGQLKVMTRNLCIGADLQPILDAKPPDIPDAVAVALNQAMATDFPGRANAWADEIARARPDLIGLQEAALISTLSPPDPNTGLAATNLKADFVDLLMTQLQVRGLDYKEVIAQVGQEVELPGMFDGELLIVQLKHREVILARTDRLTLSNAQGGKFAAYGSRTIAGTSVALPWAWAWVDATLDDHPFRFATCHLDPDFDDVRLKQAEEFLDGPAQTRTPIVWVGDFNSDAEGTTVAGPTPATETYKRIIDAGFLDAWRVVFPAQSGFTCCQANDLKNLPSTLNERVDLVLTRGDVGVLDASIVGADPGDRLVPSGLWPSDHAGVVVTLQL
jgi:endonuclease/exonuclease/phosphatase family metal-dependent hydrolase